MRPPNKKRRLTRKEEMNIKKVKQENGQPTVSKEDAEKKKNEAAAMKENTKKREAIRKHPQYIEIMKKIEKLKNDNRDIFPRTYRKNKSPVAKSEYYDFKEEVLTRTDTESPSDWDKIKPKKINGGYKIDAVVASEARKLGEDFDNDTELLIKWHQYPVSSFESEGIEGDARIEHEVRTLQLDYVEFYIRHMKGDDYFDATFPNRYVKPEGGQGSWRYVSSQRARYRTKLRAIESYFNKINRMWGLPLVYIEDWTNLPMKDVLKAIKDLIYIQENLISSEVDELLKKYPKNSLAHIECTHTGEQCRTASDDKLPCCGKATSMVVVDQVPYFSNGVPKGKSQKKKKDLQTRIECTDKCACDPATCDNRSIQRGRQHETLIFRVPGLGWTLRSVSELSKNEFVGEYNGRVRVGNCPDETAQRYDIRMGYEVPNKQGEMVELFIAGYREGNETRYISHGCTPNLYTESSVVERHGLFFNRQGFHADRLIIAGEELTFDYFPELGPEQVDCSAMFDHCQCDSVVCRFTEAKVKAVRNLELRAEKRLKRNKDEELLSDEEDEMNDSACAGKKLAKMEMNGTRKRKNGRSTMEEDFPDEGPSTSKSMGGSACKTKRGAKRNNPGCSSWNRTKCDEEADRRKGPYPLRRILSPSDDEDEGPSTSNGNKRNGAPKAGPNKQKRTRSSISKKDEMFSSDEKD